MVGACYRSGASTDTPASSGRNPADVPPTLFHIRLFNIVIEAGFHYRSGAHSIPQYPAGIAASLAN